MRQPRRAPHVLFLASLDERVYGYQARLLERAVAGTTRYYAVRKYGPRKAKLLARKWLERRTRRSIRIG